MGSALAAFVIMLGPFGFELSHVRLTFVGHLVQHTPRVLVAYLSGKPPTLGDPSTHLLYQLFVTHPPQTTVAAACFIASAQDVFWAPVCGFFLDVPGVMDEDTDVVEDAIASNFTYQQLDAVVEDIRASEAKMINLSLEALSLWQQRNPKAPVH